MAEKLVFLRTRYTEFDDKNAPGQLVKGYFVEFLSKEVDEKTGAWKILNESQFVHKEAQNLVSILKELVPGQYINFDFAIEGRKTVVLTNIIPGEMAVDFDMIL